jgi:hypothetical protein
VALADVRLIRGRAAVHLMKRRLADDANHGDSGRCAEALEEVEVRVTAAGHREALVEAPHLFEQGARHEQAVALPQPVEPVAVTDEVADLE